MDNETIIEREISTLKAIGFRAWLRRRNCSEYAFGKLTGTCKGSVSNWCNGKPLPSFFYDKIELMLIKGEI